jgi:hypothetical protein
MRFANVGERASKSRCFARPVRYRTSMERFRDRLPVGEGDPGSYYGARRATQRWPLHADFELLEPPRGMGVVINASAGGLRVAIDRPLHPGQRCVLRLRTAPRQETTEQARVVWIRQVRDGWIAGMQFEDAN